MSRLIGISGLMGSGKDTLAALMQYHISKHRLEKFGDSPSLFPSIEDFVNGRGEGLSNRHGWETRRFADKLKECAALILGVPRQKFEDQAFKMEALPKEWDREVPVLDGVMEPMSYRVFLQELGTEGARSIHPQFWVNALFSDFKEDSNWFITDARFPNEGEAIKSRGGIMIQVVRTINRPIGSSHASERAMENYGGYDYTVLNNSTIEELSNQALHILLMEKIIKN